MHALSPFPTEVRSTVLWRDHSLTPKKIKLNRARRDVRQGDVGKDKALKQGIIGRRLRRGPDVNTGCQTEKAGSIVPSNRRRSNEKLACHRAEFEATQKTRNMVALQSGMHHMISRDQLEASGLFRAAEQRG